MGTVRRAELDHTASRRRKGRIVRNPERIARWMVSAAAVTLGCTVVIVSAATPGGAKDRGLAAEDSTPPPVQNAPPQAPPPAGYVGTDTCVTCHDDQKKVFVTTPHGRATD